MFKPLKFHLVHRDDRDPLALDENSSGFVLQPIDATQPRRRRRRNRSDTVDDDIASVYSLATSETASLLANSSVKLPVSVLGSEFEEKAGILARNELVTGAIYNAPEDVQAALLGNSSEEFEELEDDFMAQAMASGSECNTDYDSSIGDISEYDGEELIRIDTGSDVESWTDEPRIRPGLLGDIDNQFENMMLQYDSDEIGELDDEVGGVVENVEDELLDDFITTSETKYVPGPNVSKEADYIVQITKKQIDRQLREEEGYDTEEDNRALEEECRPKEVEQWDCESILSTLSNLENHPRVIKEPKAGSNRSMLRPIPEDQKLPDVAHSKDRCNLGVRRPDNESSEERRARKQAVREARQQRRSDKKQLRLSFSAKHTAKLKNEFYQKCHNSASIKL